MAHREKTATGRTPSARKEPAHDQAVIVVRRGAKRRMVRLKKSTSNLPVVLKWDTRKADRRKEATRPQRERRCGERRQTPPFSWDLADFLLELSEPIQPARRRRSGGSKTGRR